MAVIYIDGNSFGKIQQKASGEGGQKRWDSQLQKERRGMKAELVRRIINQADPNWQVKPSDKDLDAWKQELKQDRKELKRVHRIETLLWGGDEHIWVVPAWKGWETIQFFYDVTKDWEFEGKPLTHAAGVVFCHHNAPIRDVVKLARQLAESVKENLELLSDKNAFAYQVLESFDHLGEDFSQVRRLRCPPMVRPVELILPKAMIKELVRLKQRLDDPDNRVIGKRRLHEIARVLFEGDEVGYFNLMRRIADVAGDALDDATGTAGDEPSNASETDRRHKSFLKFLKEAVEPLATANEPGKVVPSEAAVWLHLIELWDYLPDNKHDASRSDESQESD